MMDEYKQIYTECANLVEGWKKLSKSELANLYIQHKQEPISDSYLAAILLKHWNLISHFYYKQGIKEASEEDCYDWLVEGITSALKDQAWNDPNNSLYNDEKGPEKAMMVCIMSVRANYYQYIKYDKRRLNYNNLSLDFLEESSSDGFFIPYNDNHLELPDYVKSLVIEKFEQKDFFFCFLVDCLLNSNVLDNQSDDSFVKINKITRCINNIDDSYYQYFSKNYEIEIERVKKSLLYVKIMPSYRIHYNITRVLNELKKDMLLKDLLKGEIVC